jgi:hypothetical protein
MVSGTLEHRPCHDDVLRRDLAVDGPLPRPPALRIACIVRSARPGGGGPSLGVTIGFLVLCAFAEPVVNALELDWAVDALGARS